MLTLMVLMGALIYTGKVDANEIDQSIANVTSKDRLKKESYFKARKIK